MNEPLVSFILFFKKLPVSSLFTLTPQTGSHITFDCPEHERERTRLLGGKSTWEEIDTPNEIRVDVNEYEGGVMLLFAYLFDYLTYHLRGGPFSHPHFC